MTETAASDVVSGKILNVNVGIMGHVDSGKTSLARALSTTLSTAALDKHPQSQERGITLDLGFSSFTIPLPDHLQATCGSKYDTLQFTLVDCPGHASLIRTIIGGAQIIDLMLLVIDVAKGIQTQTAECLVVGEILMENMLIVLNKVDQFPADQREERLEKTRRGLQKVFAGTKFKSPPMVAVSATGGSADAPQSIGMDALIAQLASLARAPQRDTTGAFYFAVDHCFPIKGQGTVLTGTVLRGVVRVNDTVELPELKQSRKVKSLQMFKRPVQQAVQGDRVGVLVTQLDSNLVERGILAAPASVPTFTAALVPLERVRFYKGAVPTKRKFHVSVGHATVMATVHLFTSAPLPAPAAPAAPASAPPPAPAAAAAAAAAGGGGFDYGREYRAADELLPTGPDAPAGTQWGLLLFEKAVTAPANSLLIGSVLDADMHANSCRLVFSGRIAQTLDGEDKAALARIRVYKQKHKLGGVKRVVDEHTVIGKDLFKKETDISKFLGLTVTLALPGAAPAPAGEAGPAAGEAGPAGGGGAAGGGGGVQGYIEGSFGSSGQYKVRFASPHGLPITPAKKGRGKKAADDDDADTDTAGAAGTGGARIVLAFKKYLFDAAGDRGRRVQQ